MECIVLSQEAARGMGLQWQLEDLGADWRCHGAVCAEQALQLLRAGRTGIAVLTACAESAALLAGLQDKPLLAPPYLLGLGFPAPDGELPALAELPGRMGAWKCAGRLPALSSLRLAEAAGLARGLLLAMEVPQRLRAWEFLPEMIGLTVVHPPLLTDLQHGLYPLVGRRCGLTAGAVERRLRLLVEATWSRGSLTGLERFFGSSVDPERGKPTNREFLCRVQERVTLAARRLNP